MLFSQFGLPTLDIAALLVFFLCWSGYGFIVDGRKGLGRKGLVNRWNDRLAFAQSFL